MTQDLGLIDEDNSEEIGLVGLNCDINSDVKLGEIGARHDFNNVSEELTDTSDSSNNNSSRNTPFETINKKKLT